MTTLREAAQQALESLEAFLSDELRPYEAAKTSAALRAALAEPVQEPDLSRCPQCGGIADNGHDRSIPPNPYLCTKCMAEMPQPSYNVTVVDDAHPNGIPLEQWQNKPVQEPVAWIHTDPDKPRVRFLEWREDEPGYRGRWVKTPLYLAPPRCPNCASLEAQNNELDRKLAEMERAHGIGEQP